MSNIWTECSCLKTLCRECGSLVRCLKPRWSEQLTNLGWQTQCGVYTGEVTGLGIALINYFGNERQCFAYKYSVIF